MRTGYKQVTLLLLIPLLTSCMVLVQTIYRIDPNRMYQTIKSFGASDAWSNEFLQLMSTENRELVADWLFSSDFNSDRISTEPDRWKTVSYNTKTYQR